MSDVVVALVSDTWTDAVRRGFYSTADQTLQTLLGDPGTRRVLVADHPRGVASQLRRRARGDRPAPRGAGLRGVRPLTLVTPPPADGAALRRRYRAYDAQLAAAAGWHRLRRPSLVTFNLWHAAFADPRWAARRVFYAQDDESAIPSHAEHRELTLAAYRRIARSGMTVLAVSQVLLDRIAPEGPGLVVPNGVDEALWSGPQPVVPFRLAPVALYAGTVDARLDLAAFRGLADGGFTVQVAGPLVDAGVRAQLAAIPGVQLLGARPRDEVVRLARTADVCLLAHHRTPLTEAMSPLKLYEYLASGTPVVATRLPGAAVPGDRMVWVEPGGDYPAAARQALRLGRQPEAERLAAVRATGWRARHRPLLELLGAAS